MRPGTSDEAAVGGLRGVADGVVRRIGGLSAVRILRATLATYDRAGGGLLAGGLAYTSLLAVLPGLLLALSAVGLWVTDPAQREAVVGWIGQTIPPLEGVAALAFESVSKGAVPSGIVAIIGLLWGSSRLYSAVDNAFSRIFQGTRIRNEVERTIRGVAVTLLIVALPLVALLVGSVAAWLLDLAPDVADISGAARSAWQLATPVGSLVLFVAATILVYRFVPGAAPPARALLAPAVLVGLVLAGFAQLFTWIAPRLAGVAAIYGTFVALFALLAWLSISFNLLLLGASWTRVRALAMAQLAAPADGRAEGPAGTG